MSQAHEITESILARFEGTSTAKHIEMLKIALRLAISTMIPSQQLDFARDLNNVFQADDPWTSKSCHRCGRELPKSATELSAEFPYLCKECSPIAHFVTDQLKMPPACFSNMSDLFGSGDNLNITLKLWLEIRNKLELIAKGRPDVVRPILRLTLSNEVSDPDWRLTEIVTVPDPDQKLAAAIDARPLWQKMQVIEKLKEVPADQTAILTDGQFTHEERKLLLAVETWSRRELFEWGRPPRMTAVIWLAIKPVGMVYHVQGEAREPVVLNKFGRVRT